MDHALLHELYLLTLLLPPHLFRWTIQLMPYISVTPFVVLGSKNSQVGVWGVGFPGNVLGTTSLLLALLEKDFV